MSFWNEFLRALVSEPAVLRDVRADLALAREQRDHARDLAECRDALLDETRMNLRRSEEARRDAEAEKSAALDHVRRLCIQRDIVARAVRSPNLTDAEKLIEIREAFAIVEGEREDATPSRTTCANCRQTILRRSSDGVWFSKAETTVDGTRVTSDCNDSPDGTHTPAGGEATC